MTQEDTLDSFWYREPELQPDGRSFVLEKILLVFDKDRVAKRKFNLTKMGLEQVNTYEELIAFFPKTYYDYNDGK